ncbi:hypothetical protein SDC9_190810 [bioreactor metagenome]|uniref:Uncharacterized protein n=1 Tax=bioreactor metagenome TaxID=1076179 RepID=A0A645HW16_9ZZZZ
MNRSKINAPIIGLVRRAGDKQRIRTILILKEFLIAFFGHVTESDFDKFAGENLVETDLQPVKVTILFDAFFADFLLLKEIATLVV